MYTMEVKPESEEDEPELEEGLRERIKLFLSSILEKITPLRGWKLLVVVAVIALICVAVSLSLKEGDFGAVKQGSVVELNWTARNEEGVLVDTNIYSVAEAEGLKLREEDYYQPRVIEVGKGKFPEGVEEALVGMKKDQEKTVLIPPEKLYLEEKEFTELDRVQIIPLQENLSRADFEFRTGVEDYRRGQIIPHYLGGWSIFLLKVTDQSVSFANLGVGEDLDWEMFPGWNATVTEIKDDNAYVRHDPEVGMEFRSLPNHYPYLPAYLYKVEKVTKGDIELSYNPYEAIADESLEFTLTIVEIR